MLPAWRFYFLLCCLLTALADAGELLTVSKCYDDGVLTLSCTRGSLIYIHNVTYGLSESNQCSMSEEDCKHTEMTSFGCNGKAKCDILITQQTKYYSSLPKCNLMGNYLAVQYECVPVSQIGNLCTDGRTDLTASSGYLATPFFGNGSYLSHLNCDYRIIGQNIKMKIITLNLTDSNDCITFRHSFRANTYCGGGSISENLELLSLPTSLVNISFISGSAGNLGGVWLYYSRNACVVVVTTINCTYRWYISVYKCKRYNLFGTIGLSKLTPFPVEIIRPTVPPTTAKQPEYIPPSTDKQTTTTLRRVITSTIKSRQPPSTPATSRTEIQHSVTDSVKSGQSWTAKMASQDDDDDTKKEGGIRIYNNVTTQISTHTLAIVLSIVFGVLGSVIIALFSIYFYKRRQDNRKKKARMRLALNMSSDLNAWHNTTNECLSRILQKSDNRVMSPQSGQVYTNNVMDNGNYKYTEQSLC